MGTTKATIRTVKAKTTRVPPATSSVARSADVSLTAVDRGGSEPIRTTVLHRRQRMFVVARISKLKPQRGHEMVTQTALVRRSP
ncbi:MAG: hypothetical protein M0Z46_17065 [Actinomycetota bacterium]|nr:hypothetical protein [Actinomycetota bacterium]